MRIHLLTAIGAFSMFLVAGFTDAQPVKLHPHHHFHHALWELRDARKELQETKHDFGGHKQTALVAIKDAIKQLDLILLYTGDNIKGVPTRGDLREEYKKYHHHPHVHHAVHELKHAHHQLKQSKHSYNGHKEAALRDINVAIVELEAVLKHHKKLKK